ncbi:MAG TPA: SMP-30/gluconolactonase/LRE family protein [Polyangiaceae bacterium]|nr:SMP-30/gluconolactonase/LRE family protein [Polyangiaceae bacterium]
MRLTLFISRHSPRTWSITFGTIASLCAAAIGCSSASSSPGETACVSTSDAAAVDATVALSTMSDGASVDAASDGNTLSGIPSAQQITFTTLYKSPLALEGLTGDSAGNLYVAGRGGTPTCPVWRIATPSGMATLVGNIPSPCTPFGLTFNSAGALFIADTDTIWTLTPNAQTPPTATAFATGVPGANGIAFDKAGNLWVSDGVTDQGRVWKVTSDGTVTEAFRIQTLANEVNLVALEDAGPEAGVGGVGRDPRALPPGSLTITPSTRTAADTNGSVALVANGILFRPDGTMLVADTGRGAIWRVTLDSQGNVQSPMGCDTTFLPDTLCLQDILVEHPILEGLDGFVLDTAGNIWGLANERNAIVVVTPSGGVQEVFRNAPDPTTMLRNGGPLEFPTSPIFLGQQLCITHFDVSRRDNFPNTGGEVGPEDGGAGVAKVSCLDQALPYPGLPLPVQ